MAIFPSFCGWLEFHRNLLLGPFSSWLDGRQVGSVSSVIIDRLLHHQCINPNAQFASFEGHGKMHFLKY